MPPKQAPTHFLCIPLTGPQLVRRLAAFKADVTSDVNSGSIGGDNGNGLIPDRAVRPSGTLHLTLGVMSLKDDAVARAVTFLKGIQLKELLRQAREATAAAAIPAARGPGRASQVAAGCGGQLAGQGEDIKKDGLSITLRGLSTMHSPATATVLYAPPEDPTLLLRRFCEALKSRFIEAGFMIAEDRPLLLHATIVNTIYVRTNRRGGGRGGGRRGGGGGGGNRERLTFDARDVMDRYEDYVWAEDIPVEGVRICRMGAKKVEGGHVKDDEAYEMEGEVLF